MKLRLPNMTKPNPEQLQSYLYQLVGDLQWALSNIEKKESTIAVAQQGSGTGSLMEEEAQAQADFDKLKSLIIKSADIVTAYYSEMKELLRASGEYVATSDFGEYTQKTETAILANDQEIASLAQKTGTIDSAIDMIRVSQSELKQTAEGISSRVTQVEGEVTKTGTRLTTAESCISQNATAIEAKVSKDGLISAINQTAEAVKINAQKIALEGYTTINEGFSVDEDGNVHAKGGEIGGWEVDGNELTSQAYAYLPPTEQDLVDMLWYVLFPDKYGIPEGVNWDINGDGVVNEDDAYLAVDVMLGKVKMEDCAGAVQSLVTIRLNPKDAKKAVRVYGVNMWGTNVDHWFGADMTDSPMATKYFVKKYTEEFVDDYMRDDMGLEDYSLEWKVREWKDSVECWAKGVALNDGGTLAPGMHHIETVELPSFLAFFCPNSSYSVSITPLNISAGHNLTIGVHSKAKDTIDICLVNNGDSAVSGIAVDIYLMAYYEEE